MNIVCPFCNAAGDVDEFPKNGQRVYCPSCDRKFVYFEYDESRVTRDDFVMFDMDDINLALNYYRRQPEYAMLYEEAPHGARMYYALLFYGKMFGGRLDQQLYLAEFAEVDNELNARDLGYLIRHEKRKDLVEHFKELLVVCHAEGDMGDKRYSNREDSSANEYDSQARWALSHSKLMKQLRMLEIRDKTKDRQWKRQLASFVKVLLLFQVVIVAIGVGCFFLFSEDPEDSEALRNQMSAVAAKEIAKANLMPEDGFEEKTVGLVRGEVDQSEKRVRKELADVETRIQRRQDVFEGKVTDMVSSKDREVPVPVLKKYPIPVEKTGRRVPTFESVRVVGDEPLLEVKAADADRKTDGENSADMEEIKRLKEERLKFWSEYVRLQQIPLVIWGDKQKGLPYDMMTSTAVYNINIAQASDLKQYKTKIVVMINPTYICSIHHCEFDLPPVYCKEAGRNCKAANRIGTANFCNLGAEWDLSFRTWLMLRDKIPEGVRQEERLREIDREIVDIDARLKEIRERMLKRMKK